MADDVDVLHLLKTFATRNRLSVIDYRQFAQAVQRQARNYDQANAFYRELALHPDGVLMPRLYQLSRDKRVSLQIIGNQVERVMLPETFTDAVQAQYKRIEENPEIPFPDEQSLDLSVPPEWVQAVSVENELPELIEVAGERPAPLYRLVFPERIRPALAPSESAGGKLLDYAVQKIRIYLRKGSNKDFIYQRLVGAFPGKEMMLKDAISTVLLKAADAISEMRGGSSDFTFPFWAYLSNAVKKDLAGKSDLMPDDVSAFQAAYLVDVYNNFFKGKVQREQERAAAFKQLGAQVRKPPYLYSMQDVADFRDGQGRPLLGSYSKDELDAWMRERTTRGEGEGLPELLVIAAPKARPQVVAKDRLLPYVVKGLREARPIVQAAITHDWREALYDFRTLDAMNGDEAFRSELKARLAAASPTVAVMLEGGLAPAVYAEFRGGKDGPQELDRYFGGGKVAPPDALLDLDRKRLLTDVRMLLPFWYTVPVMSWIIGLFKRSSRKRADRRAAAPPKRDPEGQKTAAKLAVGGDGSKTPASGGAAPGGNRAQEFSMAAMAAEKQMLPEGYALEDYLETLANRWNVLLDPVAKANLKEDIDSLVRDYLRGILRSMKPSGFTPARLQSLAANLAGTPNLMKIRNHDALEEYMRLYMVKLLKR